MNRHPILYSFLLVACFFAPVVGSSRDGDDTYSNLSDVPGLAECEVLEPTLLNAYDVYTQAVSVKAQGSGGLLSILDDKRVLTSIRTYLRALTALRDCRRALYDRTPSLTARKMIVIPRCELPGSGVIDVAPGLQLSFGAMATERITTIYDVMRTETWRTDQTTDLTSTLAHRVTGVGVCELSSTGHVGLLSDGKLIATYSSGMWEIKDVACKLGKYAGSGRTFQFQGSRAQAPGATEFGHDAGLLILDTPTVDLNGGPTYWERYQLTKRKVRIGDTATGFALKLRVDLDPGTFRVRFRWDNGNEIVLDWQRRALVSSNFLPAAYYGSDCETKVVCRDGTSHCAYDRERFIPALGPLPPGAQARLEP
jgi:hypothetical protein